MPDYNTESPAILRDFLSYHETIKSHSRRTVDEYFLDLRNFFRYLKQARDPSLRDLELNEISIMDVDLDFVKKVTITDIYGYMSYLSRDRVLHQNSDSSGYGLNAASRARKLSTIRSFYGYLCNKAHLLDVNPVKDLDMPKLKKSLPRYLTLDESMQLLDAVDGQNRERDYCILTIFLNCGLRISELCGLNIQDIQDDALRVLGKGNKVRIVYLNDACKNALKAYSEASILCPPTSMAVGLGEQLKTLRATSTASTRTSSFFIKGPPGDELIPALYHKSHKMCCKNMTFHPRRYRPIYRSTSTVASARGSSSGCSRTVRQGFSLGVKSTRPRSSGMAQTSLIRSISVWLNRRVIFLPFWLSSQIPAPDARARSRAMSSSAWAGRGRSPKRSSSSSCISY